VSQEGTFHVGTNGPEWWDLASRPDLLRRAASATGGRVVGADDVGSLADAIRPPEVTAATVHEARLWNHPLPFVILLLALGAEWWMRRRGGLA
jgi:hypothetical protein